MIGQASGPALWSLLVAAALGTLLSCGGNGRWSAEWEERFESFQPSEKVMDIMEIGPGMAVGEIGAGNGRFAVKVAARVGPTGTVYANDVDRRAISFMRDRCERDRIDNMVVIHGEEADALFPEGSLDLIYLINTFDELSRPVEILSAAHRSLKPGGRLAIAVYDPSKLPDHGGHAVAPEVVVASARGAGLELILMDTSLVYDNIYIFRRRADGGFPSS